MKRILVLAVAMALLVAVAMPLVSNAQMAKTGNVIFIHPDGSGLNHWSAARIYWKGPDAQLEWDQLPFMAAYRGHMADQLTGTSNAGATTHAFGYKVEGRGSFGLDGDRDKARPFLSLSGYPGSIMREARNNGHPVGVVNDGQAAEPGTAAFLAEVGNRDEFAEIVRQMLQGRPGFDEKDEKPDVILSGGEMYFMPKGTPKCEGTPAPNCYVHEDPITGRGPQREDNLNLIQFAVDNGYTVIRTRAEFDDLMAKLKADSSLAPRVLGLFAADDIFNDQAEERLIAAGLVKEGVAADDPQGRLILFGGKPGTPSFNPPTAAEMAEMALIILERRAAQAGKPFFAVFETESVDNFGNSDNAIGTLTGLKHADEIIGLSRAFQARVPNTLILTAADSDAGGLQVVSPPPTKRIGDATLVTGVTGNPTDSTAEGFNNLVDGIEGRGTRPFRAAPDAYGNRLSFAVVWIGLPDVAGGVLSRAQGLNAELLQTKFSGAFDNTDVYRLMYQTLFGRELESAVGKRAPDRK
ncbi:MAG: alkaline phosphatase [Anaerolineae bacterium]|nr:alkaline phosphatase [Anaerolineae bacterium]